MPQNNRPLSPHLGIYRPQLSSMSSILIRITGVCLLFSFILITGWLFAAAAGQPWFDAANAVLSSWLGRIILVLTLLGLCYHFLGGIRHLIFDMGYGLQMRQANIMSWCMLIGSVVLTVLILLGLGALR